MNSQLRPTQEALKEWALHHDDVDVAFDAAFQLAQRDRASLSFTAFVQRWVPAGDMSPVLFDRFADAWVRSEGEKAVAQMGKEVPIPEDLRGSPSGE